VSPSEATPAADLPLRVLAGEHLVFARWRRPGDRPRAGVGDGLAADRSRCRHPEASDPAYSRLHETVRTTFPPPGRRSLWCTSSSRGVLRPMDVVGNPGKSGLGKARPDLEQIPAASRLRSARAGACCADRLIKQHPDPPSGQVPMKPPPGPRSSNSSSVDGHGSRDLCRRTGSRHHRHTHSPILRLRIGTAPPGQMPMIAARACAR
jgi:hypothetical protein